MPYKHGNCTRRLKLTGEMKLFVIDVLSSFFNKTITPLTLDIYDSYPTRARDTVIIVKYALCVILIAGCVFSLKMISFFILSIKEFHKIVRMMKCS